MVGKKLRIGAIIQARCGSSRLPRKVLMPLPFGGKKEILLHIVERAASSKLIDVVIVATSQNVLDNQIQTWAEGNGCLLYRGSENDVLNRFYRASQIHHLDVIIRLTGDNPFIDPQYIDQTVEHHLNSKADYTKSEGLPLGMNLEIMNFSALQKANKEANKEEEREHVTPFLRSNPDIFSHSVIKFDINAVLNDLRLTVDYPSDYATANLIFAYFSHLTTPFHLSDIEGLLTSNAWIQNINQDNYQKKIYNNELDEINDAIFFLNKMGLDRASKVLERVLNEL